MASPDADDPVGTLLPLAAQNRVGKKSPALTVPQLRRLLEEVLPLRRWTRELKLALIAWVQKRNHQAYCSHRKGRRGLLESPGS